MAEFLQDLRYATQLSPGADCEAIIADVARRVAQPDASDETLEVLRMRLRRTWRAHFESAP